jgi:hypothetical protein
MPPGDHTPLGGVRFQGQRMIDRDEYSSTNSSQPPAWAGAWHLWNVIVPHPSISGRLLHQTVWRRHDGHQWQYMKFELTPIATTRALGPK